MSACRIRGIMVSPRIEKVAEAVRSTPLGLTPVLEVLMQDYTTLPLFSLQEETKEIPLTQGQVAIVSACDYDWLMQWKWFAREDKKNGKWYARCSLPRHNGERGFMHMHRAILNAPSHLVVDHRDGDGLNNSRGNLRLATHAQNLSNRPAQSDNSSGFKGVCWHKGKKKWHAQISVNGKKLHLGDFRDLAKAAGAYDAAARKLHGEFAYLNFPDVNPKDNDNE